MSDALQVAYVKGLKAPDQQPALFVAVQAPVIPALFRAMPSTTY